LSRQLTALDAAMSSGPAGPTGGGRGTSQAGPPSAARLAADQAAADAATAQLVLARQNLAAATLTSPISGTVVSVSVTPGASAAAGGTAFVVAGLDSYQVTTSVPVTDMPELKAGQQASVQPDGMSTPVSGSVTSIGLAPGPGTSPAAYPLTIGLSGQPAGLHAGGLASVTITTAHVSGVSVPTSAVHISGHAATVTVYAAGHAHAAHVTVGAKGPVLTRITAGLAIGQRVVLASLGAPLPTNNLSNRFSGPFVRPFGSPGFGRFVQINRQP
jgi:HlyD family secretion protein